MHDVTPVPAVVHGPLQIAGCSPAEALVVAWLAGYRSPATCKSYAISMKHWFEFCATYGADPIHTHRSVIELWQRQLESLGRQPRTVSVKLAALGSFLKYCLEEGIIDANPMAKVKRPVVVRESPRNKIARGQFFDLVAGAEKISPTAHALILLLGMNGLRIGEACALNIDDRHTTNTYPQLIIRHRKGWKKGLITLARQTEAAVAGAIGDRTEGPILRNREGQRLNQKAAQRIIDRAVKNVRGDHVRITPHVLRHTGASIASLAGVSMSQIMHDFGWSDPRTAELYIHGHEEPIRSSSHLIEASVMTAA